MIQLETIEIYYFRSIYTLKIKNLRDLCVFSGQNDCGKSNILKALNLFFNNETDWKMPFEFSKDFSRRRLEEVRKETIKGKQFIRVKLHFLRGKRAERSLPEKFFVSKTWYRDSYIPELKSSIEQQFKQEKIKTNSLSRAQAGLQNYLNRIRFEYLPAIKDRDFFRYSLGLLQDTILQKKSSESRIEESVKALNDTVEKGASILSNEFERVCGIKTDIRLPQELAALFRAFSVETKSGNADMPLTMRGDGIQTRFLPSLLHYVASNSNLTYLWGFEEPENCLEHSFATELADELQSTYSKESQIFLTSHSPAFINLQKDNVSTYRIYLKDNGTESLPLWPSDNKNNETADLLKEELGLLQLAKEQQEEFERRKKELEVEARQLKDLSRKISEAQSPILLTEGKSDSLILEEAWRRLYPDEEKDFRIIPCDPLPGEESAGGAGMLQKALVSCRLDQPLTIGLFDRDVEGIRKFNNLDNNFSVHSNNPHIKIHKNKNVAAFLIPDIPGKEDYINAENLLIEFLFPEDYIIKKHNGNGLNLSQKKRTIQIEGKKIEERETTEPHYRKIVGNKMYFAKDVVPKFPDDAFVNFRYIFNCFRSILQDLKQAKD